MLLLFNSRWVSESDTSIFLLSVASDAHNWVMNWLMGTCLLKSFDVSRIKFVLKFKKNVDNLFLKK